MQALGGGTSTDGRLFRQGFSNPAIFALVGAHHDNQVVSRRIVRVQKIGHNPQQAQPSRQDDKFVLFLLHKDYGGASADGLH